MQFSALRAVVSDGDPDQDIVGSTLRVFYRHVEVAVVRKHARVHQLEFRTMLISPAVLFNQLRIGKRGLRVLVQVLHVGMRGGAVQIVVTLLNVLSMIALVARQAEEPFFQDRIAPVPHGYGEADVLMPVADSRDTILVPAVGSGSSVIVRKILPGVAIRAVIFSDRSPGAFTEVRT